MRAARSGRSVRDAASLNGMGRNDAPHQRGGKDQMRLFKRSVHRDVQLRQVEGRISKRGDIGEREDKRVDLCSRSSRSAARIHFHTAGEKEIRDRFSNTRAET